MIDGFDLYLLHSIHDYAGTRTHTEGRKIRDNQLPGTGTGQEHVRHYLHSAEVKADQAGISGVSIERMRNQDYFVLVSFVLLSTFRNFVRILGFSLYKGSLGNW